MRRLVLLAAALAAAGAVAPGARAQCRLCTTPTTAVDTAESAKDVRIDIETSLDFDRVVLSAAGAGAAVLYPDGSRSAHGVVSNIGPRAMVGVAVVHGEPNRLVRVELPKRIELFSLSGGSIAFDEVTTDLPSLPKLDSAGNLSFRFGGRIQILGDADGEYRGDLPITVEYQ
jgi:hypothetical protein